MKRKLLIVLLATLMVFALCFAACNQEVTITFDLQDGSNPSAEKYSEGYTLPQDPVRDGYVFGGWYTDKECTEANAWTLPEKLTKSVTLYAKWTQYFTVTFDAQNGSKATVVEFNANFALPETPVNEADEFVGWYTDEACSEGNEWTVPETLSENITVYAKWLPHVHDFGESYFMFVECSNPNCHVYGRTESTNVAKENFVYTFSQTEIDRIESDYQAVITALTTDMNPEAFEELFETYDDDIYYVVEQYQVSYVFYKASMKDAEKQAFDTVSNYYNESVAKYYGLFRKVYESKFKDTFFEGWTEEEIHEILVMSDSYGSDSYQEIKNKVDDLLLEYDEMMENKASISEISAKYGELVALNNELATLLGYDNYMEYAYESRYDRPYTPSDVAKMRGYVKQYIAPVMEELIAYINNSSGLKSDSQTFYSALDKSSVFKSGNKERLAVELIGSYFKEMASNQYAQEIDFFQQAEDLFKNGNYYLGADSGAFSYWIPSQKMTILFFGSGYQSSFTFIHEFGHYYNNIYNKGLNLSMDHDETQSQGDEMMFLAWLSSHVTAAQKVGYKYLMSEELANMLYIVCLATAVDEFEQAAYTGLYEGEALPLDDNGNVDYATLFKTILATYSDKLMSNGSYWSYVVFESAGYYISYAMSALPSVELFVKAMEDFDSAKEIYFKLFTFSDNPELVETDESGNRSVIATYSEILEYAGLKDSFQEQLYLDIAEYFLN